jgi:hypothetical protein
VTRTAPLPAYTAALTEIAEAMRLTSPDQVIPSLTEMSTLYGVINSVTASIGANFAHQGALCLRSAATCTDADVLAQLLASARNSVWELSHLR